MRIPDDKLEEVRQAADIVEVVGEHVKLKRQGTRYVGLCPFHKEKSPSFSVDSVNRLYYCFGCHAGGDVFSFVRQVEGVGFTDAVRTLAERFNVPLPDENASEGDAERASRQEAIYHALRFAGRWFYHVLTQTDEGAAALDYLTTRGMSADTIRTYGLGYAPDRWDGLARAAEDAGLRLDDFVDAGLVGRREGGGRSGGVYDRYRGRVVFPIFAHTGRVVGFGGRILAAKADDPKAPKYINSPQTLVYDKSRVLYGLYQGRQEVRKQEEAILVEGYMDVLALHQAGYTNAVATCGTSLTPDQVALAGRYAKRIVMLYDGDGAGVAAALKGAETAVENWRLDPAEEKATWDGGVAGVLARGLIVYMVALPPGDDPDSYVRVHGREGFERYLAQHRQDFVGFAAEIARRNGRLATPDGAAEVLEEIVQTVSRLPSPLLQQTYLRRAAEVLDVPTPALAERLSQIQAAARPRTEPRRSASTGRPPAARGDSGRDAGRDGGYSSGPPPYDAPPPGDDAYHRDVDDDDVPLPSAPSLRPEEGLLLSLMLREGAPMVEYVLGRMALTEFTDGPPRDLAALVLAQFESGEVSASPFLSGQHGETLQRLAAHVLAERETLSAGWGERSVIVDIDAFETAASSMTLLKLARIDEAIETSVREQARLVDSTAVEAAQRRHMGLLDLRRRIAAGEFLAG